MNVKVLSIYYEERLRRMVAQAPAIKLEEILLETVVSLRLVFSAGLFMRACNHTETFKLDSSLSPETGPPLPRGAELSKRWYAQVLGPHGGCGLVLRDSCFPGEQALVSGPGR